MVGPDGSIGAVHRSLQEYLSKPPTHSFYHCAAEQANRNISFLCADYLHQSAFEKVGARYGPSDEEREKWCDKVQGRAMAYPFVGYAALFWIYHARISGDPFHVALNQWKHPRHRRLLNIRDDAIALCWKEVWWDYSREGEDFPGPNFNLDPHFPDEGRRVKEVGWEGDRADEGRVKEVEWEADRGRRPTS